MIRKFFAIISGATAGALLSTAISNGLWSIFPDVFLPFNIFLYYLGYVTLDEHWFLRALVSIISSCWAGFIAGLIGRNKGSVLSIIAVLPAWITWLITGYIAITGYNPFLNMNDIIHISLGNKISITFIILAMFPASWYSGAQGEITGQEFAAHFDSRKYTLLGIKWYHYFWIPIVMFLILLQGSFYGIYFLEWVKELWKAGHGFFGWIRYIIPGIFTVALWGTLYLMGIGVRNAYLILAGFENIQSRGKAFLKVLQYAIGFQIIAILLQRGIELLHFLISKWLA
jgi:hypothetical protein